MSVIDDYLKDVPKSTFLSLSHIRALVHKTVLYTEEILSYGIPSFRMNDFNKVVLGFAINKRSLAIYPHSGSALDKMRSDITKWRSSPSALNFTIDNPIPDNVIIELLHIRTNEIESGYGKNSFTVRDSVHAFDKSFILFARSHYSLIGRVSLFVIYFLFGFLKVIGLSPADALAIGFANKMGVGSVAHELFFALALIECCIGVLILFPEYTRMAIFIMLCHMLLVSAPLFLYPEAVYSQPFVPNLEGQYILKNAALVALALGLVAATPPLKK